MNFSQVINEQKNSNVQILQRYTKRLPADIKWLSELDQNVLFLIKKNCHNVYTRHANNNNTKLESTHRPQTANAGKYHYFKILTTLKLVHNPDPEIRF